MKKVNISLDVPNECPLCGNPNINISGSMFGEIQSYRVSCMQCGYIYGKKVIEVKDET